MLATGEFRGTATACRARSSATAWARTGSQRRRSRRIRSATVVAVGRGACVGGAAGGGGVLRGAVWGAGGVGGVGGGGGAVGGRHNEAKPNCSPGFDSKMMMNQKLRRRSRGPVTTFE